MTLAQSFLDDVSRHSTLLWTWREHLSAPGFGARVSVQAISQEPDAFALAFPDGSQAWVRTGKSAGIGLIAPLEAI